MPTFVLFFGHFEPDVLRLEEFHSVQIPVQRIKIKLFGLEYVMEGERRVEVRHVLLVYVKVALF